MNTHAVSQVLPTKEMLVSVVAHPKSPASLEQMGIDVSRYGLMVTLLLIGVLKFSAAEAHGIQPLVANSPLMSWLYRDLSLQGVSNLIGTIEIIVASLIALRPFFAENLIHRQLGRHHHLRAHCEFSPFYTGCLPVVTRVSYIGRRGTISHQGSCSTRRIDLDCG
jgi:hypothetical protein